MAYTITIKACIVFDGDGIFKSSFPVQFQNVKYKKMV